MFDILLNIRFQKHKMKYYTGTWNSTVYPFGFVYGTVIVELNEETLESKFILKYHGQYMRGKSRSLISHGVIANSRIYFNAFDPETNQTIKFDIDNTLSSYISGSYFCHFPDDVGTILLSETKQSVDQNNNSGDWCSIS